MYGSVSQLERSGNSQAEERGCSTACPGSIASPSDMPPGLERGDFCTFLGRVGRGSGKNKPTPSAFSTGPGAMRKGTGGKESAAPCPVPHLA